ncbi:MAG: hypothetical protein WC455_28980, partial [Dehalococcoidia bacterium]
MRIGLVMCASLPVHRVQHHCCDAYDKYRLDVVPHELSNTTIRIFRCQYIYYRNSLLFFFHVAPRVGGVRFLDEIHPGEVLDDVEVLDVADGEEHDVPAIDVIDRLNRATGGGDGGNDTLH